MSLSNLQKLIVLTESSEMVLSIILTSVSFTDRPTMRVLLHIYLFLEILYDSIEILSKLATCTSTISPGSHQIQIWSGTNMSLDVPHADVLQEAAV